MTVHRPTQHLQIMPVGWGFLSLHTIDHTESVTIITDGGTLPLCYRKVTRDWLVHDVKEIFRSSNHLVWIISHFDYDHISITAQLLKHTNKYADLCIIPFTYSVKACRKTLVSYLAFIASVIRIRPPSLPEALGAILNRCRRKILVKRGSRIHYDNYSHYEFLWPDARYNNSVDVCDRIQRELNERIKGSCKRNPEICENLDKIMGYIGEKLELIGDAEPVKELNLRKYLHRIEEERVELSKEFTTRKLMQERIYEKTEDIGERFLRVLETYKLRDLKERLENVYSLAYILGSLRPTLGRIEIIGSEHLPIHCRASHKCYIFWPSRNIMMYLGDLDNSSIDLALDDYVPTRVSVLVPAHHGNRWHTKLSQVKARITYLNRCDKHTRKSYRRLRQGYLRNSRLVIIGGHEYYLYYNF